MKVKRRSIYKEGGIIIDETKGLRLLEELMNEPEKFYNEGKSYYLWEEYNKGLSRDTLRALFYSENKWVKRVANSVAYELGARGVDLLDVVLTQFNDKDEYVLLTTLSIAACYARNEYIDSYIRVFSFFEHESQKIRLGVMGTISCLFGSRIHEALVHLENKDKRNMSHEKGLLSLLDAERLSPSEIRQMIASEDAIIRKYGIIAAKKCYKKYPQIIKESQSNQDLDVSEYSKRLIRVKLEYLKLMSRSGLEQNDHSSV